jgi:hypothetical protein
MKKLFILSLLFVGACGTGQPFSTDCADFGGCGKDHDWAAHDVHSPRFVEHMRRYHPEEYRRIFTY